VTGSSRVPLDDIQINFQKGGNFSFRLMPDRKDDPQTSRFFCGVRIPDVLQRDADYFYTFYDFKWKPHRFSINIEEGVMNPAVFEV